jgi:TolB-like protein/DNA-binding winged helix-turn-helix (wHTH) protein/Tfp pilus assembly protein PilF
MASEPIRVQEPIRFGDDFQIDVSARRLRCGGHVLKLERIPLEILILLLEHRGEILTRDEIVAKVWGRGVFLETDNSIRGAIRKIRQVLKDDPEQPRFIQTVTGQGYRFIAAVITADEKDLAHKQRPSLAVTPTSAQTSHGRDTARARRWLVLGAGALLGLLVIAYVMTRSRRPDTAPPKVKSLAVLPLKNLSGDPTQEYLADGMTEALIGRLSGIRDLRVISRTSMMRFKDTRMSAPEITKTLQVDAIVEGSVQREGSRVRVHAQLIRGATDEHFWSETYDRELREVLALESELAQAIARKVEVTVTSEERARLVAARPVAPEVYESYLKGWFGKYNTRADIEESIAHFEQAISKDPTFAPAYVGLALSYDKLGELLIGTHPGEVRSKVISAARKALELDPELAEPHALLGYVYQTQWQWSEAEAEYRRALELNPNDVATHLALAQWLLAKGRTEEALAESWRARELNPVDVTGLSNGGILFDARRYDEAIRELRSVLVVRPDYATAHWFLGSALIANGQPTEAIPVLEKAASLSDRSPAVLGVLVRAYAHAGRDAKALRVLAELKRRQQKGYVPAAAFVNAYLGLGEHEQAFVWLERAYQEHSIILQYLKVNPFFDPLRDDPRFKDLVRRVGLDQER